MKKTLSILVVLILVLGGLGAVAIGIDNKNKVIDNSVFISYDDELDQFQNEITENLTIPIGQIIINDTKINIQLAQSFIPSKDIITRVELLITKNVTAAYPLIVSIRKELTDEDIISININPEQVPAGEFDWIVADFNDTHLITGQTYYIVTLTENVTDNYYGWYGNNTTESYPLGCLWYSIDDGNTWSNESSSSSQNNFAEWIYQNNKPRFDENITWDMCFRTYGRENIAPNKPSISGKTHGKINVEYTYSSNTVDSDGDQIYYWFDWGDGTNSSWVGPYASNVSGSGKHTWDEKGTYQIKVKAKDIFDAESGWSDSLSVKIPRNRGIDNPILRFFDNHPLLFRIF